MKMRLTSRYALHKSALCIAYIATAYLSTTYYVYSHDGEFPGNLVVAVSIRMVGGYVTVRSAYAELPRVHFCNLSDLIKS